MRKLAVLVLLILTTATVGGQAVFAGFNGTTIAPDLTVTVTAPTIAFPGENVSAGTTVQVSNIGTDPAIGNLTAPGRDT